MPSEFNRLRRRSARKYGACPHGRITVLNRSGVEARTCECYAVVKKECDRLLPYLAAA